MTMHLAHPSLSLAGKRKGKRKFRNADEARRARELEQSWQDLKKKWSAEIDQKKKNHALTAQTYSPPKPFYRGADTPKIPSLNNGVDTSPASLKASPTYTGTLIKGIATMHKSNAVPVINDEDAVALAHMRR